MSDTAKKNKPKIFTKEPCSPEFASAFVHTGSLAIDCQACGRTHFYDWDTDDYELGEYEGLKEKERADPDRYIATGDDSTPWGTFGGMQVVTDCPCNYARVIEDVLWNNRFVICSYFAARAKKELKEAQHTAEKADGANSAIHAVIPTPK